jgi:hypothetical protein
MSRLVDRIRNAGSVRTRQYRGESTSNRVEGYELREHRNFDQWKKQHWKDNRRAARDDGGREHRWYTE